MLILVLMAAVLVIAPVVYVKHHAERHGLGPVLWRVFTASKSIDGQYHTDRRMFRSHTRILHPAGRASRLWKGPRAVHWAVRTGVPLVLLAIIYGLIAARALTIIVLAVSAAAAIGGAGWRAQRWARGWQHHRHYVQPLEARLAHVIGRAPERVAIERDGQAVKAVEITWRPEDEISPADQPLMLEAVTTRLAIEAPEPDKANFKGRNRTVRYTQSAPPPPRVSLADLRAAIEGSGPDEIVVGLGRRSTVVSVDLHSDSPHIAESIGPGGGKTIAAEGPGRPGAPQRRPGGRAERQKIRLQLDAGPAERLPLQNDQRHRRHADLAEHRA